MGMPSLETERARLGNALSTPPLVCGSVAYDSRGPRKDVGSELPLVSIVTVTYNADQTVGEALESVAKQSYPGPIEYIVIDGGSTDRTLEIVSAYGDLVDCLVSEPDNGIYDALNKGLRRARGDLVALLNADDRLMQGFIEESVRTLQSSGADISYCNYLTESGVVEVDAPNDGILLSQLGIKHNTFLAKRRCFEIIGGFDSRYQIVADAKWNRAAYASGLQFVKVPGVHVYYSLRGLSSASTSAVRNQVVRESAQLLLESFDELDRNQAEMLYLSNFNSSSAEQVTQFFLRYRDTTPLLAEMVRCAVCWNIANRPGYQLRASDLGRLRELLTLAKALGIDLKELQTESDYQPLNSAVSRFLSDLGRIEDIRTERNAKVHLHFARKFSSPSETFIHDFLTDLDRTDGEGLHVILCDDRLEAGSRAFPNVLTLPWDSLGEETSKLLYGTLWDRLAPVRIVAHFALNGWKLHDRLTATQRARPWVNMCHGIDVFSIDEDAQYSSYIRDYCALAPNVVFTAVSDFLCDLLASSGVPDEKIFKVPNAVSDRFYEMRKVADFWNGTRTLRILSIGRLIEWKGHHILLEALAEIRRERPEVPLHLEIVYGKSGSRLSELTHQAAELGLAQIVHFVPFVDFHEDQDYLPSFDLFVLPSTESTDATPRSETFGVSILEAIVAGLPVVGTDAGGIPEVVGTPNPQAAIVPHGRAGPLAQAVLDMMAEPDDVFREAGPHASARMDQFSPSARLSAFAEVDNWFDQKRTRILHFCALGRGGAAGATINVHKGLLRRGYDSVLVTRDIEEHRLPAYLPNVRLLEAETVADFRGVESPRRPGITTFSLDAEMISSETIVDLCLGSDLINFTWAAKFLSVSNVATVTQLGIPVTITLRDMNALTGGCHFFHGCQEWQTDCGRCHQLPIGQDATYSGLTLAAKRATWNLKAVTFIALSDHSTDILERSALAKEARHIKLENYVDTDVFYTDLEPFEVDLPPRRPNTLTIGYLPSFDSRIKGHEHLCRALIHLHSEAPDINIRILVASDRSFSDGEIPFEVINVGSIAERNKLRRFYNATDMVAVPSLEETFSNTTLEALACGTPVVGYRTGILAEVLADGRNGRAVKVGDHVALASAIADLSKQLPSRAELASRIAEHFGETPRMDAYETALYQIIEGNTEDAAEGIIEQSPVAALRTKQEMVKSDFVVRRLSNEHDQRRRSERELCEQTRKAAEGEARVAALQSEIQELKSGLTALHSSRSWRLTAPYRCVGRAVMWIMSKLRDKLGKPRI